MNSNSTLVGKIDLEKGKHLAWPALALLLFCIAFMLFNSASAQLNIGTLDSAALIDFNSTVSGVHYGGATQGFIPNDNINGYLDSDAWSTTGWSEGNMNFGTNGITGDKWRGVTYATTSQSTGGLWGILISNPPNNYGIGVQPGGSDFTPGSIVLKMVNTSGVDFDSLKVSYDLYVRNDQARSNSFDMQHSANNSSYSTIAGLQYTSPEVATGVSLIHVPMTKTFAVTWLNSNNYYLRWYGDDVGGGGSRDEFFIDNISVTAKQVAVSLNTVSLDSIQDEAFCVSSQGTDSTSVFFSSTGTFNLGNIYYVEMSDASGSFTSVDTVGSLSSTSSNGVIEVTIAAGTIAGSGYRFRVASSDPNVISTDNGQDIIIGSIPSLSASATNLNCFEDSTGSIDLTVNGGTSPFTFNWSNTATTEDISALPAATYSVMVTDSHECEADTSITLSQPVALSATAVAADISCNTAGDGSVDLTVTGGTTPYTFLWSNTAVTEDISGLSSTTYSVVVTDSNGCTATASDSVAEPIALSASAIATDITCNGDGDGAVALTVTGGTGAITFAWTNTTAVTEDLSGLSANTYDVTVTDANGCTATASATVNEPAVLSANAVPTALTCNASGNGAVNLTASGGTGVYTYLWSNSAVTEDITGVSASTYTVVVTDANSCSTTASATVTQPAVISTSASATSAACGISDGALDLTASGGTPGYSFLWSTTATTEDITGLSSGSYTVVVTDAASCTKTSTFIVNNIAAVTATESVSHNGCYGDSVGSIDITASAGTTPYTFLWSNTAASEDLAGLAAGMYTLTITDAASCQFINTYEIEHPDSLALTVSASDISCNGAGDGSVDLTVTGGTGIMTFAWTNTTATSEDLTSLSANTYDVVVTDANGCTADAGAAISEPAALTASVVASDMSCNGAADGSVDLTVAGGTGTKTFAWTNTTAVTEDLSSLGANTYDVVVTDANGCTATASATVAEPAVLTASAVGTDISCNGAGDGSVDLTVAGGTGTLTFAWTNTTAVTEDLSSLGANTYDVVVTDANGCTATASATVAEPAVLTASAVASDISCNGAGNGSVDLTVADGTGTLTFAWTNTTAVTEDLSSLGANTYDVVVTDANGCTATASATVAEPAVLTASAVASDISCNGLVDGSVDLTVTGGTGTKTYAWTNSTAVTEDLSALGANTYSVVVTDANGCTATASATVAEPTALTASAVGTDISCNGAGDGSVDLTVAGGTGTLTFAWTNTTAVTEDLSSLGANTYSVVVTDANGCTATASATVTEPTVLTASAVASDISCNGAGDGSVDLTVTGGTGTMTFVWTNTTAVTEDLSSLGANTYSVVVTDASGCTATASATVAEPVALTASAVATDISCNGAGDGSVDLTVTGGTGTMTFVWTNTTAVTEDLSSLGANTYDVVVTDANGCTAVASATVAEPTALTMSAALSNVLCNGDATGAIDLTAAGGTAPYSYDWNGTIFTEDLSNVAASSYSLTVTDQNGCEAFDSYVLNEPAVLSLTASASDISCPGGADGAIDITVAGGVLPYGFSWSNTQSSEDINALSAGTFTIEVTDSNNCEIDSAIVLTQPAAFSYTSVVSNTSCNGGSDGAIDGTTTGGTSPYSFAWSSTGATEDLSGITAGDYTLTITDDNACEFTAAAITITEPEALTAAVSVTDVLCEGCFGAISVVPAGGTEPYTFEWSNGETTQDVSSLAAGDYTLTITDANGCELIETATVSNNVGIGSRPTASVKVNAYPNPFTNQFTVQVLTPSSQDMEIEVRDLTGRVVFVNSVLSGQNDINIDASKWSDGIFFYQVNVNNQLIASGKLIKQ